MLNRCPAATRVLEEGIAQGLHRGAQVYASRDGAPVADFGIGETSRGGAPMTDASITLWMSAVKPVTAVAVAMLWERGLLDLDDAVARHVPQFGQHGKDRITLRDLLTHTGGFRVVPGAGVWSPEPWDSIIERLSAARLEPRWIPGKKAGYHIASAWFVLGEVVQRLSGRPFDQFVRSDIFEPLGMADSWVGMPPGALQSYQSQGRLALYEDTSGGAPDGLRAGAGLAETALLVRPSGNGRGPIRELGKFYEMLLARGALTPSPCTRGEGGGEGRTSTIVDSERPLSPTLSPHTGRGSNGLLSPQAVEAITARHRVGMFDHTFNAMIDWGLGFAVNSNHYEAGAKWPYGFGPHASSRTFGHGGYQSSCAFCDPENRVVVAWTCNGFPGEAKHQERNLAINTAIYEDLGLELSA